MGVFSEFKAFISRGNVLDMSVGVIMGAAFGKIVTALTQTIIMPIITLIAGKANVAELTVTVAATEFPYGQFLQAVIDFLFTAIALFVIVKMINTVSKKFEKPKEEEPKKEPEPSKEEVLLTEIRDLLKNK